jgi:polynucleotide kinase-phosphatase
VPPESGGESTLAVPSAGLVVLVRSDDGLAAEFATRKFDAAEVVAADMICAMIADDSADATTTAAAEVVDHIVGARLRRGVLTVVDDPACVAAPRRRRLLRLAADHNLPADAVVFALPSAVDGSGPPRARRELERSLRGIGKEGFRRVHYLRTATDVESSTVVREADPSDRRELVGPFDVIGSVQGCADELGTLLAELGWDLERRGERVVDARHPQGRTAVFLGDVVGPGPGSLEALRLVMAMVARGNAVCLCGDREDRLLRALADDPAAPDPMDSLAERLRTGSKGFRKSVSSFVRGLAGHYRLDGGRLVVAHAGIDERHIGRSSSAERAVAVYGPDPASVDVAAGPQPHSWATRYRGAATVVYTAGPCDAVDWIGKTVCIETGVDRGGSLTAFRYPEHAVVSVPSATRDATARPANAPGRASATTSGQWTLRIDDVTGHRAVDTAHAGRVEITGAGAAAALEIVSRVAVDPRWLVFVPPGIAPCSGSDDHALLEHPGRAFDEYRASGVPQLVCEERWRGSRAIAVIANDAECAARRFGVDDGAAGVVYSRIGRRLFAASTLVDRIRAAAEPLFTRLQTTWLVLDLELSPPSTGRADGVQRRCAEATAPGLHSLGAALAGLRQAAERGLDVGAVRARTERRLANVAVLNDAGRAFGERSTREHIRVAPLQILAAEGSVLLSTKSWDWQLAELARFEGDGVVHPERRVVDVACPTERADAERWWRGLAAAGRGMVVRPAGLLERGAQPALAVRGRDQLRLVYGPDYLDRLDALRTRDLTRKRELAVNEHGLAVEGLQRFVRREPLTRVHEAVVGVLALASEPVDPRL